MPLLRPHPARAGSELSCEPFFIVTAGRSGSTLLRLILNQDPSISIPPESHVLGQVSRRFARCYRFLPWEYTVRLVVTEFETQRPGFGFWQLPMYEVYRRALELPTGERSLARLIDLIYVHYRDTWKPGAERWGDKSIRNAFFLPRIEALFPGARYLLLIRDGRDVAVSLSAADTTPVSDLGRNADWWRRNVSASQRFVAGLEPGRHLEVRYEDLVRRPEEVVRSVYGFLGLEFRPQVLQVADRVDSLGDANREIHRNLRKPINADSIGKWRRRLDGERAGRLEAQLADKLLELGYPLSADPTAGKR